jgi:glycosyltransferase involved in cell wall biosynthesis
VQALPSVVIDDQTGLLLAPEAGPEAYANRIFSLITNWPAYLAMAEAGVERANNITNWDHMAESMSRIIFD